MIELQFIKKYVAKATQLKGDEECLTRRGNVWRGLKWRVVEVLAAHQDTGRVVQWR
jgi:hypothetical protein